MSTSWNGCLVLLRWSCGSNEALLCAFLLSSLTVLPAKCEGKDFWSGNVPLQRSLGKWFRRESCK